MAGKIVPCQLGVWTISGSCSLAGVMRARSTARVPGLRRHGGRVDAEHRPVVADQRVNIIESTALGVGRFPGSAQGRAKFRPGLELAAMAVVVNFASSE